VPHTGKKIPVSGKPGSSLKEKRFEEAYALFDDYWKTHDDFFPILRPYFRACLQTEDEQRLQNVLKRAQESSLYLPVHLLFMEALDGNSLSKAEQALEQLCSLPSNEDALRLCLRDRFRLSWRKGELPAALKRWSETRKALNNPKKIDSSFFLSQYVLHVPLMMALSNAQCM